ncbi:VIT1/CCC1 transporter family protein [Candidatus Protochlamydia phocaeensis]|uniref:VIT1/CCC1 transporter family protein n=1 Tax=Candidatus Protochlamydia phocaeensis TaxID=1414722 RepID=UPI0008389619
MKFELGLEKADPFRAFLKRLHNCFSYVLGGIIPLFRYLLMSDSNTALLISASATLLALFCFGLVKGYFIEVFLFKNSFQTVFVREMAAGATYLLAKAIS